MSKQKSNKSTPLKSSMFEKYKWHSLIFFFVILLYANSIPNDYNMDDELVTLNHRLTSHGITAIPEIFTSTYYKDESGYAYEYRPVVLTTFAIEHDMFGDSPKASHFINLILYAVCCVIFFIAINTITAGLPPYIALAIALLFAAHPSHTEVVSSIKNRDEILGLIFSLLAYLTAFKTITGNLRWLWVTPILFLAALLSKLSMLPFAIIIPAALIIFTNVGFKKIMIITLPFAIITFFVINNTFYEKLAIAVLIQLFVLGLFYIVHFQELYSIFIKAYTFGKQSLSLNKTAGNFHEPESFGNLLNSAKIDSSYFTLTSLIIPAIGALLLMSGVYSSLFLFAGFTVLLLLVFYGNEQNSWWANIFIYAGTAFILVKLPYQLSFYSDLLILSIAFQILYGRRKLLFPLLFLSAVLIFLFPVSNLKGLILALVFCRFPKIKYLSLIVVAFSCFDAFEHIFKLNQQFTSVFERIYHSAHYLFIPVFVLSLFLKKGAKFILLFFQIFTILFFLLVYNPITKLNRGAVKDNIENFAGNFRTNIIVQKQDRPLNFVEQPVNIFTSASVRMGTSLEILGHYLYKVILPYPMAFYYGYKFIEPRNISSPILILCLAIYILLSFLSMYFLRINRLLAFGLLVYLVSIVAVSGYFFPIPGQMGERFMLIPSIGWCIVYVSIISMIFRFSQPKNQSWLGNIPGGFKYSFVLFFCVYSSITFARNFDWKDSVTLMRHDIGYVNNSAQAHNLLALKLMKKSYEDQDASLQLQERTEALGHFKKAVEIYPDFYNANYDIARVSGILNQPDSTIKYFQRALQIDSTNSNPAMFISQQLMQQGKYSEAIPYLEYVTRRRRDTYEPYDKLSFAYFKTGDYKKSIAVNDSAIARLVPQAAPYVNIAQVYKTLNQTDTARIYLQRALQLAPNDPAITQMLMQLPTKK